MTDQSTVIMYCQVHPSRETALRCRRCDRPMCTSCAVRTPTGYVCRECVRQHQKIFETAVWLDYVIVFFAASFLSGLAAILTIVITSVIWGFFIIALAPAAGVGIGNLVRRFVKNHRSRALNITFAVSMVLGTVPVLLVSGLPALFTMMAGGADFMSLVYSFGPIVWQVVYLVLGVPAAYYQFSGLVFRR